MNEATFIPEAASRSIQACRSSQGVSAGSPKASDSKPAWAHFIRATDYEPYIQGRKPGDLFFFDYGGDGYIAYFEDAQAIVGTLRLEYQTEWSDDDGVASLTFGFKDFTERKRQLEAAGYTVELVPVSLAQRRLEVAKWEIRQGARNVVSISASGDAAARMLPV